MTFFGEIAVLVAIAALFGIIAYRLKQPTIIGYLLAGLVAGSLGLLNLNNSEVLRGWSEVGIALLLFLVGLEMNWQRLKETSKPALLTGLGQLIFTFGTGFAIAKLLGFSDLSSVYISIALTFSSTIVVIQLLSQKKDLGSLYGKIVVGFLLVQDFVAVMALVFLAGFENIQNHPTAWQLTAAIAASLVKGLVFIYATIYLARRVFPKILDYFGASQEILFLFSLAWGLGLAAIMASPFIGLSLEIGGFLAGLALANSITNFQIASRIKPIRDFFIMIFFISLGARLMLGGFSMWGSAFALTIFVLVGNPLIVMLIMSVLGYRSRTSFLASLTVAQISEFSLIIAAMGLRLGHINNGEASLVTAVGIATIAVSSYFIMHGETIYSFLKKWLKFFEFRGSVAEEAGEAVPYSGHVVLVGAHRMGENVVEALRAAGGTFVVVDFDPQVAEGLLKRKIPVIYGDVADEEICELAGIARAKVVISTVPDFKDSEALISYLKKENPKAKVIVTAESEWEAREFYNMGAAYAILPHFIGGMQIAQTIRDDRNFSGLAKLKEHDLFLLSRNG